LRFAFTAAIRRKVRQNIPLKNSWRFPSKTKPISWWKYETSKFHASQTIVMKALIIYRDFASAAKANTILQRSFHNSGLSVQWNIKPYGIGMLKFPPNARLALADAADAHLLMFAGCRAHCFPFWLQDWLERWASVRQIKDVALAVFREANSDRFSQSGIPELLSFADRHGLSFILDDDPVIFSTPVKKESSSGEDRMQETNVVINPISPPVLNTKTRAAYRGWDIAQ
jgi:hypothetical protein